MRIGIDTHAAEKDGSGNCTYIRNLVQNLIEIDRENDYLLFVTDPKHPFYARLPKKDNFEIHSIRGKPAWLRVFFTLPIAALSKKVDLLHVQYFAPLFYRRTLVVTIHDLIPFRHPEHFSLYEKLLFRAFLPGSAKRASRILTVSDTSKNDLIHLLNVPAQKINVTYDGVDPSLMATNSIHSNNEILKRFELLGGFFLSVGRIDSRKNLGRLVDAFDHAKRVFGFPHKLVIAGKVYFESEKVVNKIHASEFASDILLTGYVSDKDLNVFYRNATALFLVSEYEGFGLPALEAMACGTPVVASDIPVFREILNESCLFVNPSEQMEISEAMQRLISEPELREALKQKGLRQANRFTWESTARLTLDAYSKTQN